MNQERRLTRLLFFVVLPAILVLLLLIFAGMELQEHLTTAPRFAIKTVEVTNEGPAERKAIIALAAIPLQANIFSIDLGKIKAQVEKNPWVAKAVISRALPDKVVIQYEPQVPVAVLNRGGMFYVNREGIAFYRLGKGDSLQYPFIHVELDPPAGSELGRQRVLGAMQIFAWAEGSKLVAPKDIGDVTVHGALYHGATPIQATLAYPPTGMRTALKQPRRYLSVSFEGENIPEQLTKLETVLNQLLQQKRVPKTVRLELGKKVVVKIAQ